MKHILYLIIPALFFTITSCTDNVESDSETAEFKFQKDFTIKDDKGNSADITLFTNSHEKLDQHQAEDFILFTSTEQFESSETVEKEIEEDSYEQSPVIEDTESNDPNEMYILVNNFSFNPEVTGFSVRSRYDIFLPQDNSIKTRSSSTFDYYEYGANGVKGVRTKYVTESCSSEKMEVKLSKKMWPFSIIWSTLAKGTLYYEGATWKYHGSAFHQEYRFRVKLKDMCNGTSSFSHTWLY